jgi:peptidoglycan/LPS O-acetylase OafA/YrhL
MSETSRITRTVLSYLSSVRIPMRVWPQSTVGGSGAATGPEGDSRNSNVRQSAPLHFPLIDALRGFAAVSVLVSHVIDNFDWESFPETNPLAWFRIGFMGVDLFFVISGFVIALSAFSRLDRSGLNGFAASFARARLARIVPLHYLTCIMFVVFVQPALVFDPGSRLQFVTHALFIHNWFLWHFGGINPVNWSVAVEMQFYALMLVIAAWLVRADWRLILAGGVAIAWAWRLAAFCLIPTNGDLEWLPMYVGTAQLPGTLDQFAIGIVLARLVRSERGRACLAWCTGRPFVLPVLAAVLLWVTFTIYWPFESYFDHAPMVVFFKTLMGLAWASVILSACTLGFRGMIALTAPLRYLGTISYGIYLWHWLVILALKQVTWLTGPTALPYVLVITFILASGSWHFFELPFMQRVRRRFPDRQGRSIQPAPA